jgi:hypothetical protein
MWMSWSRTAIIPVSLVVFGLFPLLGSPMMVATGIAGLLGAVTLTIMLVARKVPSADVVPNSWPDSGFRNSRQRGR